MPSVEGINVNSEASGRTETRLIVKFLASRGNLKSRALNLLQEMCPLGLGRGELFLFLT